MYAVTNAVTENLKILMEKIKMIYCNHYKTCCHIVLRVERILKM